MNTETRIAALAKFLEVEADEISEGHCPNHFECGAREYLVLDDGEADKAAADDILNSIWAFRPEFLAAHSGKVHVDVIRAFQDNGKCESNNEALRALIADEEHFIADAIKADGRGHFLAGYDSEENEVRLDDGTFLFIYRVN